MNVYIVPEGKHYHTWDDVLKDAQQMKFTAFNTGSIYGALEHYVQPESLPHDCDPTAIDSGYAVMVFHFRHPGKGDILIDTGFDRSFYEDPPFGNLPISIRAFQKLNSIKYTQQEDEDLPFHLNKHNIKPAHVFLTHMHPDHTAGIPALSSDCRFYYGKKENSFYYRRLTTGSHLKNKKKTYLLDFDEGVSIAPFDKVLDVFGDGTFWALSTPGHTKDHISYLINTTKAPILLTGDAELTKWGMENGVLMGTDYGKRGEADVRQSAEMIRAFRTIHPQVEIWFSHDEQPY
jgi:glyoxylase-like metal-dependent hydrolase (beta-lactamase superfamily II)